VRFRIEEEIFEKFPDLSIGTLVARGIDNRDRADEIMGWMEDVQEEIRNKFESGTLSEVPKIDAWRKAYRAFGAKPKKHKSSVESLYRSILKGSDLRSINKIVDIYNFISIKHMVPLGGDDVSNIEGDIELKFANGDEHFKPLNSEIIESVKPGEIVYIDERDVLCRRWNWRECDRTKMTEETSEVLLVAEGLPPVTRNEVKAVLDELDELVKTFCGGEIQTFVLDRHQRECKIL
jgi:lysyl-tRNA synthetase class 2